MKYTVEQLRKWNSFLQNGFCISKSALACNGEKEAVKKVQLADRRHIEMRIFWQAVPGGVVPRACFRLWSEERPRVYVSTGMGAYVYLSDNISPRRDWKKLAAVTASWTAERILTAALERIPEASR